MYSEWTAMTARIFTSHALCLRRHESPTVLAPESSQQSLQEVLRTVFTDLLQWIPHRTVRVEQESPASFYMDEHQMKVLSIAHLRGVGPNSLHAMKHRRLEALGWRLEEAQFRGVSDKSSGASVFSLSFLLKCTQSTDVRHHAMVAYSVSEVGRSSVAEGTWCSQNTKAAVRPAQISSTSGKHARSERQSYVDHVAEQNHSKSKAAAVPQSVSNSQGTVIRVRSTIDHPEADHLRSPIAWKKEWW